jgi:hypothetical protein
MIPALTTRSFGAVVRRALSAATVVMCVSGVSGQGNLMFFGIVKDAKSGKAVHNATLRIVTDSVPGDSVFTDPQGSYQIFVPLGGLHHLEYTAEGHDRKVVEVDARADMGPADRNKEWNIRIDISLVREGIILSDDLLDTPVGRSKWVEERHAFEWDTPYSERYQIRYKQEVKAAKQK